MDDVRLARGGAEVYVRPSMEVIEMGGDVIVTSCFAHCDCHDVLTPYVPINN